MKWFLQIIGLLIILMAATVITLKVMYQDADGPSALFPGGKLVSGELHAGPDPDWAFTDDIITIDLETSDGTSRRIFIMESDGEIYVGSAYMKSMLGQLWKQWAFDVEDGLKDAVIRVDGIRYERTLKRVTDSEVSKGVVSKFTQKYAGGSTAEAVEQGLAGVANGDMWLFRLEPRT